jgi:hypothetical protein
MHDHVNHIVSLGCAQLVTPGDVVSPLKTAPAASRCGVLCDEHRVTAIRRLAAVAYGLRRCQAPCDQFLAMTTDRAHATQLHERALTAPQVKPTTEWLLGEVVKQLIDRFGVGQVLVNHVSPRLEPFSVERTPPRRLASLQPLPHTRVVVADLAAFIAEELSPVAAALDRNQGDLRRLIHPAHDRPRRYRRGGGAASDEAVLETLATRIAGGEVDDLRARLPVAFHPALNRGEELSGG